MPIMKTHKGCKKMFNISKSGKMKQTRANNAKVIKKMLIYRKG